MSGGRSNPDTNSEGGREMAESEDPVNRGAMELVGGFESIPSAATSDGKH